MFILGCHRSGTSLLSGVLSEFIEDLNPGSRLKTHWLKNETDNPKGFHESLTLTEANKELLKLAGSQWDKPFLVRPDWSELNGYIHMKKFRHRLKQWMSSDAWVDKDPRLCLTREAYLHIFLKDVSSIAIIRDPISVANSLFMRDGIKIERGIGLWIIYNYFLFNSYCTPPKASLIYNELINRSEFFATSIVQGLDQTLLGIDQSDQSIKRRIRNLMEKFIQNFDPSLDRSINNLSLSHLHNIELAEVAQSTYKAALTTENLSNPKKLAKIFHQAFHLSFDSLQELFPHQFHQKSLADRKPTAQAIKMLKQLRHKLQTKS